MAGSSSLTYSQTILCQIDPLGKLDYVFYFKWYRMNYLDLYPDVKRFEFVIQGA
jgi:hypothetical protein